MGKNPRILYVSIDEAHPIGGVKVHYLHVKHLIKSGFDAYVLHLKEGFRPTWFDVDIPILYGGEEFELRPDDILVIPENNREALNILGNVKLTKYIFCQNHYYVFYGLKDDEDWRDFGITGVFCCSEIISEFIKSVFDYTDVPVIHNAIDVSVFKPGPKRLQIAYMPRKRAQHIEFIKNILGRINPRFKDIPWVPIDNRTETEVAEILGESALFFSSSTQEGFGLPPLEAMSCGCVVVGFHGDGGREYADKENGLWCDEGDLLGCAQTLANAVTLILNEDDSIDVLRQNAAKTASMYNFSRQENEVVRFWQKAISS